METVSAIIYNYKENALKVNLKGNPYKMISHPFILLFYLITGKFNEILSFFHKKISEKNFELNDSAQTAPENGFIDDQSKKKEIRYGKKSFSHSGCGLAAVYNAMMLLGLPMPLAEIIRYFEKHGASFFASFGTAPQSAVRFFRKQGVNTESTMNKRKFKELAERSDILLFTIMNDRRRIRSMVHTMCVECLHGRDPLKPAISYIVHNSHGKAEAYECYEDMMYSLGDGEGRAEGVYMLAINRTGAGEDPLPDGKNLM